MQSQKTRQQVVSQEIALDSYLSTLLDDIPSDEELDQVEAEQVEVKPELKTVEPAVVKPIKKAVVQVVNKDVTNKDVTNKEQQVNKLQPLSVMPGWAQNEFQALFFRVDKLILAVPLTDLLRTMKLEKKPAVIPEQPDWFMGLLDTHDYRIGVLDMGQLIYGKSRGQRRDLKNRPFQSMLITHDGKWGLACDEILTIGKLDPDKVRWRTLRNKKPWLVGTVIEELTAVIDINHLVPRRKESRKTS